MSINISITDAALAYLKKNCESGGFIGFYLSIKKAGCSGWQYMPNFISEINPSDIALDVNGLKVYLDSEKIDLLKDTVINLKKQDLGQSQIVFKNPHATSECGCGESFSFKDDEVD